MHACMQPHGLNRAASKSHRITFTILTWKGEHHDKALPGVADSEFAVRLLPSAPFAFSCACILSLDQHARTKITRLHLGAAQVKAGQRSHRIVTTMIWKVKEVEK